MSKKPTYEELEKAVSERKRAEKALRESERKARTVLNNIPDIILTVSHDGTILSINRHYSTEMTVDETIGKKIYDFVTPDHANRMKKRFERAFQTGKPDQFEEIGPGPEGPESRWYMVRLIPIKQDNKILELMHIATDITERKQTEKALRESENRYRLLADNVTDVIWIRDMNLRLTYISPSIFEQQGYTVEEAMVKTPEEAWLPESLKLVKEVLAEELEIESQKEKDLSRSRTLEVEIKCKDGSTIWAEAKVKFLRDQNGDPIGTIGVTRDISDRKRTELALIEGEERYRSLVENTIYGFFIYEIPSGRFLFLNQRVCELYGYTMQEGLELTVWDALSPEDHERIKKRIQARAKGKKLGSDIQAYTAVRKDGSTFRLEVSSALIIFKGRPAVQGVIRDVTEQERLEQQLNQAQKMESIGTLAGGIAHDFNNLLMGIQGRTSLMLNDIDFLHPHSEHLKGIEDYIQSATDLTKQLLGFAMRGKYEVKPTNLNDLINKNSEMFGRTKKEITIHRKAQPGIWTVEVDQSQINQVMLNLYVNAWQSMPGGGELYLETENVILDDAFVKPYEFESGKYVKITVADTGVGMDKTTQERIFDPFFTTKEMGRGTGLGLASAYGIIKSHGGIVNVSSNKGEGTTFNIYLPASEKVVAPEKFLAEEMLNGQEAVLLVDDEDIVIDVGTPMLEKMGYNVMTAKSGKEAVEIYTKNKHKLDLVILDMIMPEMGGGETYDKLIDINPDVKVLLSSGYSINGQASEIIQRGCNGFIQKPFSMRDLSQKVREILDKK